MKDPISASNRSIFRCAVGVAFLLVPSGFATTVHRPPDLREAIAQSTLVVVGTPIDENELFNICDPALRNLPIPDRHELEGKWSSRSIRTTIRVDESFKGPAKGSFVAVLSGIDNCSEGGARSLRIDVPYVLFASEVGSETGDGVEELLYQDKTMRTVEVSRAGVELIYLRKRKAGTIEQGALIGSFSQPDRTLPLIRGVEIINEQGRFVRRHWPSRFPATFNVCATIGPGATDYSPRCHYFPDAQAEDGAGSILVSLGGTISLPEFKIPWVSHPCEMAGMVMTPAGKGAAGVRILQGSAIQEEIIQTDASGAFQITISIDDTCYVSFCLESTSAEEQPWLRGLARIEKGVCPSGTQIIHLSPSETCGQ